jgi:hypothetical protein
MPAKHGRPTLEVMDATVWLCPECRLALAIGKLNDPKVARRGNAQRYCAECNKWVTPVRRSKETPPR